MFEYSCFLHPLSKGADKRGRCQECELPFDFPLREPPASINGCDIVEPLNRGFYGAVYRGRHPRTGDDLAFKVVPVATYAPSDQGGYGKDFVAEAKLQRELATEQLVADVNDWGIAALAFGAHEIECHWMQMEFVDGRPLVELLELGPRTPQEAAQVIWDLLDVIAMLQQHERFHNDLHGENIFVRELPEREWRRHAIAPNSAIKVLDLGSASEQSRSSDTRLGDIHWIARHIVDLANAYERVAGVDSGDIRFIARLRRIGEYYASVDDIRRPRPQEMQRLLENAWAYRRKPWAQDVRLRSVGEHYNAQSLPEGFAPALFYDPEDRWASRLTGHGPQVLTGMRGCGKTVLLHSLEWVARVTPRDSESDDGAWNRAMAEPFLGLLVSCSALLRGQRDGEVEAPIHRLFLAYCRELLAAVEVCDLQGREVVYSALEDLNSLIERVAPWYEKPAGPVDFSQAEKAISAAMDSVRIEDSEQTGLSFREAFDELVAVAQRLVPAWEHKILLFLLDDVSTRYLSLQNVELILSQVALQSPEFGFKVSTERQTLELTTPGGASARLDRDYQEFDLGQSVLNELKGRRGVAFITEILDRRLSRTDGAPFDSAADVLGTQVLTDLARALATSSPGEPVYWGINALAAMCTGDIGEIILLYEEMLSRHGGGSFPVSPEIQHGAAVDASQQKLLGLASLDPWLYSHAVAFAQASHRELRRSVDSDDRIRQYRSVFVKISPEAAPAAMPRILELVDKGIFVLDGVSTRARTTRSNPYVEIRLAYRRILGLTSRMPVSGRDRFEPSESQVQDWLVNPSIDALEVAHRGEDRNGREDEPSGVGSPASDRARRPMETRLALEQHERRQDRPLPPAHVLYRIESEPLADVEQLLGAIEGACVIGALGFEDRSLSAWLDTLDRATPRESRLIRYIDQDGFAEEIIEEHMRRRIEFVEQPVGVMLADEEQEELLSGLPPTVAVDVTAMVKPLIYQVVRGVLLRGCELVVIHRSAGNYLPSEEELLPVAELFDAQQYVDAFKKLDELVKGEQPPYQVYTIGKSQWDPTAAAVLAAFVALKHKRLAQILDEMQFESVQAISPVHSSEKKSVRAAVIRRLAEALSERHGGRVYEIGALDHIGAYERLLDFQSRFVLEQGMNLEIALSGTKMHAVGAGMFGAVAEPAAVYYTAPRFEPALFTTGSGKIRATRLRRVENEAHGTSTLTGGE